MKPLEAFFFVTGHEAGQAHVGQRVLADRAGGLRPAQQPVEARPADRVEPGPDLGRLPVALLGDAPLPLVRVGAAAGEVEPDGVQQRAGFVGRDRIGEVQVVDRVAEPVQVLLPIGKEFKTEVEEIAGKKYRVYTLPEHSQVRSAAVSRWSLALVIAQAVSVICLWGTLVGSMLPLVFKRLGVDPGIASSPFVATFVDVTGIIIYFSIAKIWLL